MEAKIQAISERNKRVEADKAWETSSTRKVCIFVITYLAALIFFTVNSLPIPYLQALIPSCGYLISTITLPPIKQWWVRNIYKS